MQILERPPRTGMEAFKLMPEGTSCQLINDVLIMSPSPTTPHARVQNKLFIGLYEHVEDKKLGEAFCAPVDVFLNNKNAFQPDILFVSNERKEIIKEQGFYGAPDLIIEILSKGTRKHDLGKKKLVYEQSGVKEYWVVDPETKWCEGFILEEQQFKSIAEFTGSLTIQMFNLKISF
jgi:Uma2 family endonuclease